MMYNAYVLTNTSLRRCPHAIAIGDEMSNNINTLDAIRCVVEHLVGHGVCLPERIRPVLIGGSAMDVYKLRGTTDLDMYCPEIMSVLSSDIPGVEILSPDQAMIKMDMGGDQVMVDVTSDRHAFGRIYIGDIERDGGVSSSFMFEGVLIEVAVVSPETLFIQKTDSARDDKDIPDLSVLAKVTTPEKIVRRLNEISDCDDTGYSASGMFSHVISNTLSQIFEEYMHIDWSERALPLIASLSADEDVLGEILPSWIEIEDVYRHRGGRRDNNAAESYAFF